VGPEDLRLNSLDRFTKRSPRFILEEHSHCEIPAGCGGVVLRWIDPRAGLPVLLDFYHPVAATLAIDGVPTTSSHLLLAPGRHVLSVEFPKLPPADQTLLVLGARLKIAAASLRHHEQVILRTAEDRSWVFTSTRPPRKWSTDPRFHIRGFERLRRCALNPPRHGTEGAWVFHRATEDAQAEPLGVPAGVERGPIYVRKVFTVPRVKPR
jgi:hypothetical protein